MYKGFYGSIYTHTNTSDIVISTSADHDTDQIRSWRRINEDYKHIHISSRYLDIWYGYN